MFDRPHRSLLQLTLLSLAIIASNLSPTVSASVSSMMEETTDSCEDSEEFFVVSAMARMRRNRSAGWRSTADHRIDASLVISVKIRGLFVFSGHRLSNGSLAPLQT